MDKSVQDLHAVIDQLQKDLSQAQSRLALYEEFCAGDSPRTAAIAIFKAINNTSISWQELHEKKEYEVYISAAIAAIRAYSKSVRAIYSLPE